jgi:PTS system nitrogen regulatory IIA component
MRSPISLAPEQVLVGVEAPDKWVLLERAFDVAWETRPRVGIAEAAREDVLRRLLEEETRKASGFGRGLAFPHVRCERLATPALCVALPDPPVDFGASDGTPARLVCLVLVPDDHPTSALRILSAVARLCAEPGAWQVLRPDGDPQAVCDLLRGHLQESDLPILARDIMRVPFIETWQDTPLKEVTMKMLRHNLEAVAVLSPERRVLGQITCDEVLLLGLPDFFKQLKSVSFIRDFDPFERYFEKHASFTAGEVMSQSYACLDEEATLIEVVFELAIRRHPKVYVTREDRLVGVIDRDLLLDRILNL